MGVWIAVAVLAAAAVVAVAVRADGQRRRGARRLRRLEGALRAVEARADRAERRGCELAAEAALARAGRAPRFRPEFTSQFGEDAFLWELFDGKLDGFYVEVGAYDGYRLSNTYAFEAVGWTGLLVEPLPERFESCRVRRAASTVVRAAVSERGSAGVARFQAVTGRDEDMHDLASFLVEKGEQRAWAEERGAATRDVEVPLTTLADLLRAHGLPRGGARIDFAVIDVEGVEAEVLDGLELETFRPRVLVIEDLAGKGDADRLARDAGYVEVARLGHNRVYADGREPALVSRARVAAKGGAVREGEREGWNPAGA